MLKQICSILFYHYEWRGEVFFFSFFFVKLGGVLTPQQGVLSLHESVRVDGCFFCVG